ncbi:hypothetical protein CSUB01_12502 [Colletotrichum sublineola]|uniref:Orc1-like AAA ATPase domain-containing protein n=1 Tax=Colletotrichum sublineola TaxID=1173701 RepID=A0A066X1P7_COLSU|nr:hypothetical protein CSUB01_12502 [Colletotrichum sublineola]
MLIPNVLLHCPAKTSAAWFELPFKLPGVNSVSRFVARQEELQRLHKALEWTGERRTVVLHGLGGMGKTQTTNEFAKKHRDEYSAVIWLDARDTTTLKQGYRHLAKRIERETLCLPYVRNAITNGDHDEIVESAMRWLDEPKNNRWLVIYDNYDDVTIQNRGSAIEDVASGERNIRDVDETFRKPTTYVPFFLRQNMALSSSRLARHLYGLESAYSSGS